MKKQFTKIKIAAENLSRSTKPDRKDAELEIIEKQVEKYRDVLDKMVRKFPAVANSSGGDSQEREKRIKKQPHYKIGLALEESSKELSAEMPLHHVLSKCGEMEKSIAECIVESELETETEVVRRLKLILDNEIQEISTLKRNVSRTVTEYASLKRNYEAAIRLDEPMSKINTIKDQQEQCEIKLEKERDTWAAQMFELIAKEDEIVYCIRDYVLNQRNYHERALQRVNASLANIQDTIQATVKSKFGTSLTEHLASTNREISYIIELCICCLVENGLTEEGLLRVGCASTKLRRMKRALEAQYVKTPLPVDYQDPHVIGSILKFYLRELPEPLLTYKYYKDFMRAVEASSEEERLANIKATLAKLPRENYLNFRYLTKFLWLVTQNVDYNKMSSHNLAIVMSPNLLWPRIDKNNPADYMGQVNSSSAVNIIMELIISHWDYFFEGEVDFFVTLQRGKLFVENKSKSNSSNEHLDRHDNGDNLESPRYGTIRRQKACAPSPPTKIQNLVSSDPNGAEFYNQTHKNNGDLINSQQQQLVLHNNNQNQRAKELFPAAQQPINNNNNGNNHAHAHHASEKPEKPPLPKQLLLHQTTALTYHNATVPNVAVTQHQQETTTTASTTAIATATTTHPEEPTSAKPVPMTRTQFFGLDNLPSPVADRKSSDSTSSLTFKPDLPQKPKIPKRPVVLGLNNTTAGGNGGGGANKSSDEESTSATNNSTQRNGSFRGNKTAVELVQEHCDNVTALQANIAGHGGTVVVLHQKESSHNHEINANTTKIIALQPTPNSSAAANTTNSLAVIPAPIQSANPTVINTSTTLINLAPVADKQALTEPQQRLQTPTTPVSPNMIMTPKRPTVPAPPPPTSALKKTQD